MKVENLHAVSHFKHPTCIQLHYARDFGTTALESAKRIRKKEEQTIKYKAGTLPLNMYQTAVHRGERLEKREEKAHLHRGTQETISSPNTRTTPPTTTLMILQWRKMVPFVICRTRNSFSFLHRVERVSAPGTRIRGWVDLFCYVLFCHASALTSQVLIIISHVIKLFRNTSKSTRKDRLVHFEERKKDGHLLKFTKPPMM